MEFKYVDLLCEISSPGSLHFIFSSRVLSNFAIIKQWQIFIRYERSFVTSVYHYVDNSSTYHRMHLPRTLDTVSGRNGRVLRPSDDASTSRRPVLWLLPCQVYLESYVDNHTYVPRKLARLGLAYSVENRATSVVYLDRI